MDSTGPSMEGTSTLQQNSRPSLSLLLHRYQVIEPPMGTARFASRGRYRDPALRAAISCPAVAGGSEAVVLIPVASERNEKPYADSNNPTIMNGIEYRSTLLRPMRSTSPNAATVPRKFVTATTIELLQPLKQARNSQGSAVSPFTDKRPPFAQPRPSVRYLMITQSFRLVLFSHFELDLPDNCIRIML
ncbi:hypothetical protein HG531_000278 [Fusarium graminearum]|nr:hypothetical protein HG531_000278 [Fusarium graminearum]